MDTKLQNQVAVLCGALKGGPGSGNFGHEGIPGQVGGSSSSDFESKWSEGGRPASPKIAARILEQSGIQVASKIKPSYTHTGQMTGAGGGTSKGIFIGKAGSATRLSYSHGMYSGILSDMQKTKAREELNNAREILHSKGYETREISYLHNTYEIQKPPKEEKSLDRKSLATAIESRVSEEL